MESGPPSYQASQPANKQTSHLGLRLAATIFAIIGLGCHIGSFTYNPDFKWYPLWVPPAFPLSPVFLVLAICWNIAEFVTVYVRKDKQRHSHAGIQPGAHVGLDLILWMGLLFSAIVQFFDNDTNSILTMATVSTTLCGILHFILFVYACHAVDRRRKLTKAAAKSQVPLDVALGPVQASAKPQQSNIALNDRYYTTDDEQKLELEGI